MNLAVKTRYWDDPKARGAFQEFVLEIHGLDFSRWESGGYWDHAYIPFSFFEGDTIVSSVCIYLLDAVIDGEATHLAQVSGVGTLPEWRHRADKLGLDERGTRPLPGNNPLAKGSFPVERPVFPFTSRA